MNPEFQTTDSEAIILHEESGTLSQRIEVLPEGEADLEGKPQILAELVIEEVSIDGMCGVY